MFQKVVRSVHSSVIRPHAKAPTMNPNYDRQAYANTSSRQLRGENVQIKAIFLSHHELGFWAQNVDLQACWRLLFARQIQSLVPGAKGLWLGETQVSQGRLSVGNTLEAQVGPAQLGPGQFPLDFAQRGHHQGHLFAVLWGAYISPTAKITKIIQWIFEATKEVIRQLMRSTQVLF